MTRSDRDPVWIALRITPLLLVAWVALSAAVAGMVGAEGALAGGLTSWVSLWLGSRIVRSSLRETNPKVFVHSKLQLALLLKLPLFGIVVFAVSRLGMAPMICFLAGYMLVYFALLVGAVVRPRSL